MKNITAKDYIKVIEHPSKANVICIDVRSQGEFKSEKIPGTRNFPLDDLKKHFDELKKYKEIYVNCGSGIRSKKACALLKEMGLTNLVNLEGGIAACKKEGLNCETGKGPISIIRQVHITAGLLIITGALLGHFLDYRFWALSAFVGCGLFYAGVSGNCLMGMLMAKMPWNK
jgi:rhodanese-related sulfurtransferase